MAAQGHTASQGYLGVIWPSGIIQLLGVIWLPGVIQSPVVRHLPGVIWLPGHRVTHGHVATQSHRATGVIWTPGLTRASPWKFRLLPDHSLASVSWVSTHRHIHTKAGMPASQSPSPLRPKESLMSLLSDPSCPNPYGACSHCRNPRVHLGSRALAERDPGVLKWGQLGASPSGFHFQLYLFLASFTQSLLSERPRTWFNVLPPPRFCSS